MSRKKNFSEAEDNYIRNNYRDLFDEELAQTLERPEGSVTRRRQRLGCWHVQQEVTGGLHNEVWKSIGLQDNHYQISNMGRVKAGKKLAALFINSKGYCQWRPVNKSKGLAATYKIHRLTAEHFCTKPEDWGKEWHVHHLDKNPTNNRHDNLIWISQKDHIELHKDN